MAEEKRPQVKVIRCPHCGANLMWDPNTNGMHCQFCGSDFNPEEVAESVSSHGADGNLPEADENSQAANENWHASGSFQTMEYTCTQCGARLYTTEDTSATFCSFCGSSAVLEGRLVEEDLPDLVIPFKVTKEQAVENYRQYVKKRSLFAPSYLTEDAEVERFRGIYMPYWVYRLQSGVQDISVPGKTSHRVGDYVYTDHYQTNLRYSSDYDGLHFDASSKFADNLSQVISPFDIHEGKTFNPAYLSGYYADLGDVRAKVYADVACDTAEKDTVNRLMHSTALRDAHTTPMDVDRFVHMTGHARSALFPVWFLCIRNDQNRLTYAAVNGQTGEVAADLPASPGKYVTFGLILAAAIFAIFELIFTMTPTTVTIAALVISLLAFLTSRSLGKSLKMQEDNRDDAGYMSVHPELRKKKSAKAAKTQNDAKAAKNTADGKTANTTEAAKTKNDTSTGSWTLLIGVAAVVLVLLFQPVSDLYYYGASLFAAALTTLNFIGLIKKQSRLATRKIPQFEKRGGDKDAVVY